MTEFTRGLLEQMQVSEVVKPRHVTTVPENLPLDQLIQVVTHSSDAYFPVVDQTGRMTGILSINDIREVMFEESLSRLVVAKDVATPNVVRVFGTIPCRKPWIRWSC